jgi:hypothetical protein
VFNRVKVRRIGWPNDRLNAVVAEESYHCARPMYASVVVHKILRTTPIR